MLRQTVSFDGQVFPGNGDLSAAELIISGYEGSNAAIYAVRHRHRLEPLGA